MRNILLFEKYINHTSFENILKNENIFLNIFGNSLTIYDINFLGKHNEFEGVLGCIGLSKYHNFFEVSRIAGEKGFGKILYILAMEHSYPKPLVISRDCDIREDALKVIMKIKNEIPFNVNIKEFSSDDENFVSELEDYPNYEESIEDNDLEIIEFYKIYNSEFYSIPFFIEKFRKENRIIKNKRIDMLGHDYFDSKYF